MIDGAKVCSPLGSAVVHASAGTGKTWFLTSRIVRLLLAGARPGSILAITFTRKAAAEMHRRVLERLLAMARADENELMLLLNQIGADHDQQTHDKARCLYESVLIEIPEFRATTFHAFCQDILRRFPLESEVPPGFDLCETEQEFWALAWRRFSRELVGETGSDLALAMAELLETCGGLFNVRKVLMDFLAHRSDWWAYTEHQSDPVAYAVDQLENSLRISLCDDPLESFLNSPEVVDALQRYNQFLSTNPTPTQQRLLDKLALAASLDVTKEVAYAHIYQVFYRTDGKPRTIKPNRALTEKLGLNTTKELQNIHRQLVERLSQVQDRLHRHHTLKASYAWFLCGQRLLEHYQKLKEEQNLLDFTDLEWKSYQLLNQSKQAEWVQFKLDQRIDHLLVDEFQDTNPTQWRLLMPLLEEMAAGNPDRERSVFLVGDEKQSIYRFRRADPKLFNTAHNWLVTHTHAQTYTQHISWRSSPAITRFVNLIFHIDSESPTAADTADYPLPNFRAHDTHHEEMWGVAEVLPLIRRQAKTRPEKPTNLRNPLIEPRRIDDDERHRQEGVLIAENILGLIGLPISEKGLVRALGYGDIMILLRDRTHAKTYEDALRQAGIPYIGLGRMSYTECLEVQDMIHLLKALLAPYDDLALTSAMRSPIFAVSDEELMQLASIPGVLNWRERLGRLVHEGSASESLLRAERLLARWHELVDRIPVHDLLDRLYCEGNIHARYLSATPFELQNRVTANLQRLLALALDADHGRYPSLTRFLTRLDILATEDGSTSTEPHGRDKGSLRILTIHGAKGLEAPVVFLANSAQPSNQRDRGPRSLIEWPVEHPRPLYFHLIGKKDTHDDISRSQLTQQDTAMRREEANLLYVALTRAKQLLFISGCEPARGDRGWYGFIEKRLHETAQTSGVASTNLRINTIVDDNSGEIINTHGRLEHGQRPEPLRVAPATTTAYVTLDPLLRQPLPPTEYEGMLYPGQRIEAAPAYASDHDMEARENGESNPVVRKRGALIHRILELLTAGEPPATVKKRVQHELKESPSLAVLEDCWQEAERVLQHPPFREFFDSSRYREARNEAAILYRHEGRDVYGLIDRLIIHDQETVLIDYKTRRGATRETVDMLARAYFEQMRWYGLGVSRLWPGKKVRLLLLFTACCEIVEVPTIQ